MTSMLTVAVLGDLPAFAAFPSLAAPVSPKEFGDPCLGICQQFHNETFVAAGSHRLRRSSRIIEGRELAPVIAFFRQRSIELLVVGLNQ
jgi:hypothetical protein